MLGETMFDQGHLRLMKQALGAYAIRHRVVADNLSNVDTQGFRAQRVDFETALAREASRAYGLRGLRTSSNHLPIGEPGDFKPAEIVPLGEDFDNGTNDVNVDREMGELVKNHLAYRLATRLLSRKYQGIQTAITGQIR